METLLRMAMGILRGMGGPDLSRWLDDLPGEIGSQIGKVLKDHLVGQECLSDIAAQQLEAWMRSHTDSLSDIVASLLKTPAAEQTLIPYYLCTLNTVVSVIRRIGRPVVIRGFLHDQHCITYWHCETQEAQRLPDFEKHPSLDIINLPQQLTVYIAAERGQDQLVEELNLKIRKSKFHKLELTDYNFMEKIDQIDEFNVFFVGKGTKPIEPGAPGIISMLLSLPIATSAQGLPVEMIRTTMKKALENLDHPQ
jgi:hypothetical protein